MLLPAQYDIQGILHGEHYPASMPHIFLVKDQLDAAYPLKAMKFLAVDAMQAQQNNFSNELKVLDCLSLVKLHKNNLPHQSQWLEILQQGEADFHWNNHQWSGRYYVMPFYQHGNFAEFLKGRTLSLQQIQQYFFSMLDCIDALHHQHYLHLDIKPSNFLLSDQAGIDHQLILIDFSLAQPMNTPPSIRQGGTPRYMSPEQFRHDQLTPQTDFYSLGVILYRMLTGHTVFQATTYAEWAQQHCQQPVPLLGRAVSAFQPVIDGLLAKNSQYRFKTAMDIRHTFLQACND